MQISKASLIKISLILSLNLLFFHQKLYSQTKCLSSMDISRAVALMNNLPTASKNESLLRELLNMKQTRQSLYQKIVDNSENNQKYIVEMKDLDERNLLRLCEVTKQYGWITNNNVGSTGLNALYVLFENNKSFEIQEELYPLIITAVKKELNGKNLLAAILDSVRVGKQQPQIFGTQYEIKDELVYLFPLQDENNVESFRKIYNLPTFSNFIRYSQSFDQLPVIKTPRMKNDSLKVEDSSTLLISPQLHTNTEEIIKIESTEIILNAIIASSEINNTAQKEDFAVFEDGLEQDIKFFDSSNKPIDLILVLDNSGRTFDNQKFVDKAANRFIDAIRPSDRIAVFTFTGQQRTYSELAEKDLNKFTETKTVDVLPIEASGVWSELQFAYEKYIGKDTQTQNPCIIIFITNGYDGNLGQRVNLKNKSISQSRQTYTDLLETVRNHNAVVIPIYVNSMKLIPTYFGNDYNPWSDLNVWINKAVRQSKRTLQLLADESGGQMYYPRELSDLDGVYETIINSFSKLYTIGYEPKNYKRDGLWRSVSLKLKKRPDIKVITKKGYYAR